MAKISDAIITKIAANMCIGQNLEEAAVVAGVSRTTLWNWRKRGIAEEERLAKREQDLEQGKEPDHSDEEHDKIAQREAPYLKLWQKVSEATARWEKAMLVYLDKGAKKDWKAAAWMLERRAPERWNRLNKVQLSGDADAPVAVSWVDAVKQAIAQKDDGADGDE